MPARKDTVSKRATGRFVALFLLLAAAGAAAWTMLRVPSQPSSGEDGRDAQVRRDTPRGEARPAADALVVLVTRTGSRTIAVEVADTPEKQALGLMYRTELAEGHGMLFLHRPARPASMWMKNTFIPLDMVFIRADGTVEKIVAETEPHSEAVISSDGPVAAVLELAGGAAGRMGLAAGDKVEHPHFR